jgi:hypothetical protein
MLLASCGIAGIVTLIIHSRDPDSIAVEPRTRRLQITG